MSREQQCQQPIRLEVGIDSLIVAGTVTELAHWSVNPGNYMPVNMVMKKQQLKQYMCSVHLLLLLPSLSAPQSMELKAEGTAHSSGSPVSPIQQPMSPCALSEQTAEAGHVAAGTVPNVAVLAVIAVADDLVQNALASKPSPDSPTEQQMDSDTCRPTAASAAVTSPCTSTDLPHDTFSDVKAAALGHAQCGVMSQVPAVAALTGNSCNSRIATEPLLHVATMNNPVSSDPAATPSVVMATAVGSAGANTEASVAPNFSLPLTAADVLHHVGSTDSVQDMFSLPSLSYGLATLPPPELLVAAANRQLGSCGSLTLCASNSGSMSVGGVLSPTAALHSKGVVLGATGGLMAAFSPLPKASGNSFTAGMGAVFPACATASAVDSGHQLDKGCLGSTLPGLLSQQQQQHTGRGTVADSHRVTSDQMGSDQHHHAVGTVGGVTAITAMMPGSSINPAEGVAAASKFVVETPIHPMFASSPGKSPRQRLDEQGLAKAADCAAVDQDSQAADGAFKPVEWRDHPTSGAEMMLGKGYSSQVQQHQKRECSDSPASAGQQLHGILLNGHSSKPRSGNVSPARSMHGMSPSGSMKSVRFSFENMDQDLKGTTAGLLRNQELEADDRNVKDTAGNSHSHRSGGSSGLNAQDHAGRHAGIHHDMRSPRKGAGSVKAASCSSPLYRHREDGVLPSWVLQQRREQARAAAQAAAAAMRGTVVDLPLPKRPPVHPVFGTMTYDAAASKS